MGIINTGVYMRKYYLFLIKREYYELYYNNSLALYSMLNSLKNMRSFDFKYGVMIFDEICAPFSVKLLNNYINQKIKHKNISNRLILFKDDFEETYLKLNYPCLIIKSNTNIPKIMHTIYIYNKNIFVCDFDNDDYFWLKDYFQSTLKKYDI